MTTLYVGGEDHILVLSLNEQTFTLEQRLDVGAVPSFLCFAPSKKRAYAAVEGGDAIASLEISSDGTLTARSQVACPGGPAYVSVDRSERWVFSASYGSGELRVYPIDADGSLKPAAQTLELGHWAHAALCDPGNQRLYVPCKGSDWITELAFDPATGQIVELSRVRTHPNSGPRHIVFSHSGQTAYAVNENDCTLLVLDRTEQGFVIAQTLSTLPRPFSPGDSGADVHLSPDERFLYVSNRGHDSLSVFSCADGRVSYLGSEPSAGAVPRNFCLLGTNRLVVAHQEGRSLGLFVRDPDSGKLELSSIHPLDERAFWVGPARAPGAP